MIETGFVGIRGKDNNPESGLYIQDLEGVNIVLAAAAADEETIQGITLLRRIEEFSQRKMIKDFLFKLSKYYQFNSILHSQRSGYIDDEFDTIKSLSGYTGLEVSRICPDRFTNIYIEYVEFFSTKSAEKILFIQDGPLAAVEIPISVVAGLNKIRLDYTATNEVVRVFMNFCSDISLFDTRSACCSDCPVLSIKGVEGYPAWSDSGDDNGFVVTTGIKSSETEILNLCRSELAFPALYAYGIQIMKQVLRSDRINPVIRNGKDDAKQSLIHWEGGFSQDLEKEVKGEYWRCLGQAVEQARKNIDSVTGKTLALDCNRFEILDSIP